MIPRPPRRRVARPPLVLITDDDAGVVQSLCAMLEDDFELAIARNGVEALDVVRTRAVDAVLLDVLMPGLDGLEVLKRIRAMDRSVGVVMLTAVATVATAVESMRRGATDFLTKPFTEEEVRGAIGRAMSKGRSVPADAERSDSIAVLPVRASPGIVHALAFILRRWSATDVLADAAASTGRPEGELGVLLALGSLPDGDMARLVERARAWPGPVIAVVDPAGVRLLRQALGAHVVLVPAQPGWVATLDQRVARILGRSDRGPLGRQTALAIEHLCQDLTQRRSVAAVASRIGVSESQLAHTFTHDVGVPVKRFVGLVRVEAVRDEYARGRQKVASIASRAGFADSSHMFRKLRREDTPANGRIPPS